MSRAQLLALLEQAEHSAELRGQLRFNGSWRDWLAQARRLGYQVSMADLAGSCAADRAAQFLQCSELRAIRPLR